MFIKYAFIMSITCGVVLFTGCRHSVKPQQESRQYATQVGVDGNVPVSIAPSSSSISNQIPLTAGKTTVIPSEVPTYQSSEQSKLKDETAANATKHAEQIKPITPFPVLKTAPIIGNPTPIMWDEKKGKLFIENDDYDTFRKEESILFAQEVQKGKARIDDGHIINMTLDSAGYDEYYKFGAHQARIDVDYDLEQKNSTQICKRYTEGTSRTMGQQFKAGYIEWYRLGIDGNFKDYYAWCQKRYSEKVKP